MLLKTKIWNKFNKLNRFKNDKEIKIFYLFNIIGIKEYSYHQVNIFIKFYVSQFNILNKN